MLKMMVEFHIFIGVVAYHSLSRCFVLSSSCCCSRCFSSDTNTFSRSSCILKSYRSETKLSLSKITTNRSRSSQLMLHNLRLIIPTQYKCATMVALLVYIGHVFISYKTYCVHEAHSTNKKY